MTRRTRRIATVAAVLAIGIPLAAPSHAASTSVPPPYDSSATKVWCSPADSPYCSVSADADASSGAIEVDVTLDLPEDVDEDAVFGWAEGTVTAELDLAEAASAVRVRATFEIDHAELGFTGDGWPFAQATLDASLRVGHDSCAKCSASSPRRYVAQALDDEAVELDSEIVVVEARVVNPDGDVPAGTLTLEATLQADAILWHDEPGTEVARAQGSVSGFDVTVVGADPARMPSKDYLAPGGDLAYLGFTGPNCTTNVGPAIGGACFRLEPGDAMARFTVTDDHTAGPIAGSYQFTDDDENLLSQGQFCGSSARAWVPDGATHVTVFTRTARGYLHCPFETPTPATTGSVLAEFFG